MCGGLFPKMSSNGISIHRVRWSPGVPSSNARYPAWIRSLVSNVVIMASMGISFSVLSHVVTDPICGCLDRIALCSPCSRSILVSFPVLTSSLASMPIIKCSPSSIHCFTAVRRSSISASLGVRVSSMVLSLRVCCLFTERAPFDVPIGL